MTILTREPGTSIEVPDHGEDRYEEDDGAHLLGEDDARQEHLSDAHLGVAGGGAPLGGGGDLPEKDSIQTNIISTNVEIGVTGGGGFLMGEVSGWVAEETGYDADTARGYLDNKYKEKRGFAIQGQPTGELPVDTSSIISAVKNIIPEVDVSIPSDILKEVNANKEIVDLDTSNGLKKAAKALEREEAN